MAPSYPCSVCTSNTCTHKYNRNACAGLKKGTILLTAQSKEILKSQLILLFTNVPPEESAAIVFNVLYKDIATKTTREIIVAMFKLFKKYYYPKIMEIIQ